MRTIECIILEKEGSKNGLHPHFDAPGQKSVKHCIVMCNVHMSLIRHVMDLIIMLAKSSYTQYRTQSLDFSST